MKRLFVALTFGLLAAGAVWAAEQVYTLRPVTNFETDPVACYADGGKAGLVADLNEEGYLASEWEAVCVVPVK